MALVDRLIPKRVKVMVNAAMLRFKVGKRMMAGAVQVSLTATVVNEGTIHGTQQASKLAQASVCFAYLLLRLP
jgi:hypothetical protein